jgi:osmotically-inducible protein OsmY
MTDLALRAGAATLVAAGIALAACTKEAALIGAGAYTANASVQERGLAGTVKDDALWIAINNKWLQHDAEVFRKVHLQVHEGRALLSGFVPTPQQRVEAVRLAWEVDGVRQVIDEIEVANKGGFKAFVQDEWLIQQLKLKLLLDKDIRSLNYSVEAADGTIYVMGVARDEPELRRVIDHARDIPYVRRVVSHVRQRGSLAP